MGAAQRSAACGGAEFGAGGSRASSHSPSSLMARISALVHPHSRPCAKTAAPVSRPSPCMLRPAPPPSRLVNTWSMSQCMRRSGGTTKPLVTDSTAPSSPKLLPPPPRQTMRYAGPSVRRVRDSPLRGGGRGWGGKYGVNCHKKLWDRDRGGSRSPQPRYVLDLFKSHRCRRRCLLATARYRSHRAHSYMHPMRPQDFFVHNWPPSTRHSGASARGGGARMAAMSQLHDQPFLDACLNHSNPQAANNIKRVHQGSPVIFLPQNLCAAASHHCFPHKLIQWRTPGWNWIASWAACTLTPGGSAPSLSPAAIQ